MLAKRKSARRNKAINVLEHFFKQTGVPPELWRSFSDKLAASTISRRANFAVKFPQNVHRADEPVFVSRIKFDCRTVAERRQTDERHIVIMNHIVVVRFESVFKLFFEKRNLPQIQPAVRYRIRLLLHFLPGRA